MSSSPLFFDDQVRTDLLRERAHMRWAALPVDVIPLTAAEPDFPIAEEIREAIKGYAEGGLLQYGQGVLREVVARKLVERHAIACTPDEIMLTGGAAAAMWLVARYACRPGDEAILFDPVDLLFGMAVDEAGARRVYSPVDKKTGSFDLEGLRELITPKTRLICLCNPHNPLGRVMTQEELLVIGELAVERDLVIMSDEVWCDIVYEPHKHISIASLSPEIAEHTITLSGFSKTFGIPGLRIGFVVAPNPKVFQRLERVAQGLGSRFGVTILSEVAAKAAYEKCWYWADAFLEHTRHMRDYAVDRLNEMNGVTCQKPEGTYVVFPDITSLNVSSQEAADYLLKEARVAVVPGTPYWFGPGAEGNIRICLSTSFGILKEGLNRIEQAFAKIRR